MVTLDDVIIQADNAFVKVKQPDKGIKSLFLIKLHFTLSVYIYIYINFSDTLSQ